jgi:tRNA-splicing ligase RtcB
MKQISERLYSWASSLDQATLDQAATTASMPFVYPHLALMPDAHPGKGSTIGSVVPTRGAVIPACVGVDIGCGMIAVRTDKHVDDFAGLDKSRLRKEIETRIPLSAGRYNATVLDDADAEIQILSEVVTLSETEGNLILKLSPNWHKQMGSLGSGNHFIEVCADEHDTVWLFLHSGSRGVGHRIAQHFIAEAKKLNEKWNIQLPDIDLAYLSDGTREFGEYINLMNWAQAFALANRRVMMHRVREAFAEWMKDEFAELQTVNCHHNFTQQEHHFGQKLWVTRKGAISACEGEWGLIPGSMGTASYVVQGKGNEMAFNSAPHGAGRRLTRNAARKTFTMESLETAMQGIEWRHAGAFLDEHPSAYKDIDQVMRDSADLVEIKYTLRQLINVKGD